MPTPEEIQKARDEFAAAAAAPVKATSFEPTALPQVSAEEIQKARDEFAAALQPKPAAEVMTKGPVTSPEPGLQVIAKPTEPPVVVPDEYAPKPKEEAVPAETPQAPLIPEAIPPEEEQRRVPIEAAGGGGGGGGYGEPTDTEKGTFGKDMGEILTKPGRGGVLGTIDTATEAGSRLFAEAATEAGIAVGAVHGFTPELTAEDKAKVKTDVGLSLTTFGRGWLEGRSFGLYVPPELTPEQKALGGDYAQQVGSLIGMGGAIKSIAAAVPTGLEMMGIKKVPAALTGEFAKFAAGEAAVTGFLYSIFDYAGRNAGAWAAGTQTEPGFSQGMISQGLQQGAAYLGMPEVAKAIHDGTKTLGPAAMALDFMGFALGGLGAAKVMTSLIESIQGRMAGRAVEPWLPQTEREVKDIKWDTKDPGEAFDILNRSSDITISNSPDAYAAYQKARNQAIKTNPAFRQAALYREMGDEFRPIGPDGKKGDYPSFDELQRMVEERQATLRTAKQEAGKTARDNATPMGTGADEATATGKVTEEVTPAPVAEAKPTPVGTGSDEVGAVAKAPPAPEEGAPKGGAPGPVAETKPTPIETIGTGDAVIKSDQVAADTQAAKTAAEAKAAPAPVPNQPEIAPETMAQASAPANVEPVTPGRNTFTETPVQTRENKITEHEDITGQTKINAVTFKRFQDFVEAKDWPKVQEELHLSSANFTQAAFDHHFNPLNLMGRLVDGGMPRPEAKALAKEYEKQAYAPMRTEMGVRGGTFRQSPVVGMQDLLKTEPPAEGGPQVQSSVKAAKGEVIPPQRDEFLAAIKDTPGAEITPEGLKVQLARAQKPEQAGMPALRTGVFYLPQGAKQLGYYTTDRNFYGGKQTIKAEAVFKNPIVAKGATGGIVPERVFDDLRGKGAFQALEKEALQVAAPPGYRRPNLNQQTKEVAALLKKWGGDPKMAAEIVKHSQRGNLMRYAIQEHIIAHAVRDAGHDGVIGYNVRSGKAYLSEIFDVRQGQYPHDTGQVFSQFPKFYKAHPVEKPAFTVKGVTTHMPILEQDGDRVVERPGPKVRNSLKQARALAPIYYSQMQRFLEDKLPGKGTAKDMTALIEGWAGLKEVGRNKNDVPIFSKAEFKQDELKWSGLIPWLDEQKGVVTKEAVVQFLKDNPTEVGDEVRGEPPENYRNRQAALDAGDHFQEVSNKVYFALEEAGVSRHDINTLMGDLVGDSRELQISAQDFIQKKLPGHDLDPLIDAAENMRTHKEPDVAPDAKYKSYMMEGPYEHYRERLSTLPGLKSADYHKWQGMIAELTAKYGESFYTMATKIERAQLQRLHHMAGEGSGAVFKGAHWQEPNVVVHTRGANRTDVDGKKAYVLEENQGDWHQQGRKEGYAQAPEVISKLRTERGEVDRKIKKVLDQIEKLRDERMALGKEAETGVAPAPSQKHKWEKKNITISFDGAPDGKLEIPAEVLGNFAVHKNVTQNWADEHWKFGRSWRVTHVPTGLIASGPKLDFKSTRVNKTQALKFAEYLHEHGKADWTFKDVSGFKGTNQEVGKDDLARAAGASEVLHPNAIGESGEPAPVRPEWSTAHKQRAAELEEKIDVAKVEREALSFVIDDISGRLHRAEKGIAQAPFSKTWPELGMKRALREAAEDPSIERLEWTAGAVQFERWGSERIDWKKEEGGNPLTLAEEEEFNRLKTMNQHRPLEGSQAEQLTAYGLRKVQGASTPAWKVAAKEQHGGFAGGVDIEQTARDRGKLLEEKGRVITSKAALDLIVKRTLSRERNNEEMSKLTDRLWERMQTEEEGTSLPRKEGMEAFYDKMLPTFMGKYVKQWGGTVGKTTVLGESKPNWAVEIPAGHFNTYTIRGPRGTVTNHDLREAGLEAPHNFSAATFGGNAEAIKAAKHLFGEYQQNAKQYPVWYVDITPEMRESILYEGQPQFRLKEADNAEAATGPAALPHGREAGRAYHRHLPQDGEGSQGELDAFQRLYQGESRAGSTASWSTLRYDEGLATTPEFQRFVASARAEGIDLVIPVSGGNFNAQIITDKGKTTVLVNAEHDREHTSEQFGEHEVGHHLINKNDPRMVALMKRVDTQSTAFQLYREWHNAASDAVGQDHLSKGGIIQEIACDYRAGIYTVEIGGNRVNFASAFRPEGQAAPGFMRTLFGRPAAMAASPRAPPPGGKSIVPGVRSRLKKAPKAPEDVLIDKYKLAKVANVGGKNWAKEQARRLEVKHMDMIREAVGEKKVGPKAIEMSKVLTNFIDHFREPEHLAKFYHDQPAEVQGWLDKFAQVSDDPDLMTIVGKLKGASEALATEAYDEEVIREAFENHQNRIYKEEKRPGHMAGAKFATATGHSQKRFYMTRLEARAPVEKGGGGKTFKVENVAENLRVLTEEIKNVIENRRMVARGLKEGWLSTDQHEGWQPAPWPQMYKRDWQFKAEPEAIILEMQRLSTEVKNSSTTSTTTKGGPAPGVGATGGSESGPVQKMIDVITNSLEVRGVTPEEAKTYVRRVQEAAVRAAKGTPETPPAEGTPAPETITTIIKEVRETLTTLEKQQKVVGHRFDEIRRKNMYMDNDGNVFAKMPLYAPPEVAKDLHHLFETQELSPTMEKVVQYNAMAKASTLAFSGFHLFSYGRNLLTIPGFWQAVHPIGYYKKGRALAEAEHPDTEGLIRNGYITFSGKPPDWSELAEDQRTALGDLMGKNALTRKTRDAFWNLIDFNAKLIFEKVGNSYKLQFAHDILNHLRNKYPHLTDEQAYYYAADHANDVFGGRNEEIAGTLFGDRLASSAKARLWSRLLILARDWTMSNLRLFMKAFQRGPSGHLARQYWGYAMAKTFAAVIAINLLVSMIDDRSAWQSFKDAFHDPKQLRWLDVNVTPFYKLAATLAGYTPTEARKYLRVGGHFYDAFKMLINPVQFFHHKQSVLARFFWEGLSGQDWRGNVFTTLNELTGVTESVMGPLTGQLTKEGKSTGAIGYGQMPSFLLHQARGVIPIPMQNMLYAMMGEMDGFTAAIKSAGGLASSANVKTEAQDLMTEYYQSVTPTTKSPEQKARTELKKELLQVYRSGDLDTFKDRLEEAVANKVVSHQEAQQWADEAPLPPGVQSFVKLPMEMAMKVLAVGTEEEKNLWMPYLLRKIGQSKPDTILKHQEALVKLLDKEGAGDTASIIESLTDPAAIKQLKFTAPDISEMHRIDMLESWGVVDTYVASLLRQQMAPKPPPRPTLSANPLRSGLGKQRSVLDKMLGIRS